MPKTDYRRGARNYNKDSFDYGVNVIERDPELRVRSYDVDVDGLAEAAVSLAEGKINEELEEAKALVEKQQTRSAKNRATRAAGRAFEEAILRACTVYRDNGIAMVNKVPENRKVVSRTGGRTSMMICVNAAKADPDFMGSLAPTGKCIVFDAKQTDKGKIQLIALTDHQREIMDGHMACGAECYVAVSFEFKKYYLIPYSMWRDMKAVFGRQYILPDDPQIQPYAVPFSTTVDRYGNVKPVVWFLGKPDVVPEGMEDGTADVAVDPEEDEEE